MLASTKEDPFTTEIPIKLRPVKQKPALTDLPQGFETFYQITREPMQMLCDNGQIAVTVEYEADDNKMSEEKVFDDRYFRMSEDFFRQVLDSLEDYAVITTDTGGNINSWNNGAEKVLGYTEPEILGLNASIFFTPEDIAHGTPEKELEIALQKGRAIDERYHVRKDQSQFWGSGLVFPLYDEGHKHRGYTKIMRNLKEQLNAEQQLF